MKNISVIIPTYKAPEYLDLCINSILTGQLNNNEIIVVVDGTFELNKDILNKYKNKIKPIIFEENYGLSKATNHGVYAATNDLILIVNDDNVFPKNWDTILLNDYENNMVLSPNQIEPYPSIFKQFHKFDFGKNIKEFDINTFHSEEIKFRKNIITNEGSTLPFLMNKLDYLKIGGWDESYPNGNVVDWDFFVKCNKNNYLLNRTYKCNFYHFVSVTHKSTDQIKESSIKERESFEYFKYKWGNYPIHNPSTNLKSF